MKNTIIVICSIILVCLSVIFIKNLKKDNNSIKVGEVTHSIFYAPFYVAVENGYFEEEGLDIDLVLISGADKVASAVLSGDVNIGFAGPEATIYIYKNEIDDYLVSFAGLTKRDGQFIVSREKIEDFNIEDLYDKEILVGRYGGMPMLNFMNGLKNNDGDKDKININSNIDFSSLTGSFIGGVGDFVNVFEPNALRLEEEGYGYVVESVGKLSGEMPYTTFFTKKSYIDKNKDILKRFNKALNRGITYVNQHSDEDVAKVIKNQFSDIDIKDITNIVKRYRDNDSWFGNTKIEEEYFNNLEDIMIDNELLDKYVPFNQLVIDLDE